MSAALADTVPDTLALWANNFTTQLSHTFSTITWTKVIRLIAIVGAYLLLRPYLMKLGGKLQTKEHEKDIDHDQLGVSKDGTSKAAKISPNSLRGQVEVPEDSDSEEDGEATTGSEVSWGKKARRRQRKMIKMLLEKEEQMRLDAQGDEEDKDIEEFLVD